MKSIKQLLLKFVYNLIAGYLSRYRLTQAVAEKHVGKLCADIDLSVADEATLLKLWNAAKSGIASTENKLIDLILPHLPSPASDLAKLAGQQVFTRVNAELRHQMPPGLYRAAMDGDVANFLAKTVVAEQDRLKALLLSMLREAMGIEE